MQQYGFITTTNIIFSLVVGSGIFFKIDDIILATGNQILPMLLIFFIVSLSVCSGVMITSLYPQLDYQNQGLTSYFTLVKSHKLNFLFNQFLSLIYFPTLIVVLALSASQYFFTSFGINNSIPVIGGGLIFILISYLISQKHLNISVIIQNSSTIFKYSALIFLIFAALTFHNSKSPTINYQFDNTNITSGIISLTFAFDGWIMVMGFSNKIKNFRRTLPLALITATTLISIFYFAFIWSMGLILNPQLIIDDTIIYQIASLMFNDSAATLINLIISICIFGALHATILTYVSYLQSSTFSNNNSSSFKTIVFFILVYYLMQSSTYIFNNINLDVSELCIDGAYMFYLLLYLKSWTILKHNNYNFNYYLILFLAILSGLAILLSSLFSGGQIYFFICLIILLASYIFSYK